MTPPRSEGFVRMPDAEFEAILTRAAEEGAKRALADVGLDGDEAALDIRDLRSLVDCIPFLTNGPDGRDRADYACSYKTLPPYASRFLRCITLNSAVGTTAMRNFGETLRELRVAQDLGLRETAAKVGISPAYLSRIERGKEKPPSAEVIKALARVLAADPDVLFRLSSSTDPEMTEFLHGHPELMALLRFLKGHHASNSEIKRLMKLADDLVKKRRTN